MDFQESRRHKLNVSSQPFLVVGLSSTDSLMVLNAPADLHQRFKDAISESWPLGIQKWSFQNDVLVIKMRSYPWNPEGFGPFIQECFCGQSSVVCSLRIGIYMGIPTSRVPPTPCFSNTIPTWYKG